MAEKTTNKLEREYVIPLRRHWIHSQEYKRAAKAVKAIKEFIARHMKVQDRDLDKVKVDTYLNSEIWFRSAGKPPARIKVRATKEGEIVRVELADIPEHHKFHKAKAERMHKEGEKKEEPKVDNKAEETKTDSEKKDEKEKEQATAILHEKEAKQDAKAQKKVGKVEKTQHPQRMALQK